MKKPHSSTAVSTTRRCKGCGRALKLNLLVKRPAADLCYLCYRSATGRPPRKKRTSERREN